MNYLENFDNNLEKLGIKTWNEPNNIIDDLHKFKTEVYEMIDYNFKKEIINNISIMIHELASEHNLFPIAVAQSSLYMERCFFGIRLLDHQTFDEEKCFKNKV